MSETSPDSGADRAGRRKILSLLREHYGINEEAENQNASTKNRDPLDIDGPSFEADKYFQKLLKENSLNQLIQTDNQLQTDIKKLDSDMKTLVYENYNKFISATETIRKMKNNVTGMEEEMKRLSENIEKISTCSDQINNTLKDRRDKINHLSGIHRLLKKLQFLVDLPSRLKKCVAVEAYAQAVKYYTATAEIFRKYDNLPSFKQIQKECDQIIEQLRGILKGRLRDPKTPIPAVSEALQLLLDLKEPPAKLREQYLQSLHSLLEGRLHQFKPQMTQEVTADVVEVQIKLLHSTFLKAFLDSAKCFRNTFVEKAHPANTAQDRKDAANQLEEFVRSIFPLYLAAAQSILIHQGNTSVNTQTVITGLCMFNSELLNVNSQLPKMGIAERASDLINSIAQNFIELKFNQLQQSVKAQIREIGSKAVPSPVVDNNNAEGEGEPIKITMGRLIKDTTFNLIADANALLNDFGRFISPPPPTLTDGTTMDVAFLKKSEIIVLTKVQVKVQQFFLFLNILLQEQYEDESKAKDEKEVRTLLLLARLCSYLEAEGVIQLSNQLGMLRDSSTTETENTINAPDLKARFHATAESLLAQYVRLRSQMLSQMLWKKFSSVVWTEVKDPKGPKLVTDVLISELKTINNEVADIFGDVGIGITVGVLTSPEPQNTNAPGSAKSDKPVPKGGIGSTTAKRPKVKGPDADKKKFATTLEFNKQSIMSQILKIFLKSFVEYVRLCTIDKFGYQQIQVDAYFLRLALDSFVTHKGSLVVLIEEIASSAADRCLEPTPLPESALAQLCESKLEKIKH
mmetsp:Transcript_3887/g.5440  ORF Transcript_3887/g.5440 Transcript_3887/m.5440 type:complete len:801 (+) Transcript_3887:2067-4469(+)